MSDDLISRKMVAEFMFRSGYCTNVDDALAQLESVPTAYDVDRVVERLDGTHINCFTVGDYKYNNAIDRAIEIVRGEIERIQGGS